MKLTLGPSQNLVATHIRNDRSLNYGAEITCMHSCMNGSLSLNQKEQEKLWSVIKMTKNTAVRSHFKVIFFFHSALSFCFRITTGIYIDERRLTSIFTCELKAIYIWSSSNFLYSDLSSDLMLVPYILLINLTGEKTSAYAQRSQRSRSIRKFRNQDGRTRTGRWKTGS